MTAPNFDALSAAANAEDAGMDAKGALYSAAFRLKTWHFVARGEFPQIRPYIAANPAVVELASAVTWATDDTAIFPGASTPLLENRQFTLTKVDSTHFSLADPLTGATIDGATLGALVPGATIKRVQELVTPYIGGGIGYAISKFDGGAVYDGVDGNFAWQLGAGINVAVSDDTALGLGYRYFDAGDVELSMPTPSGTPTTAEQDVNGSSVLLQLTHKLN